MLKVMALDIATNCGWAIGSADVRPRFGTFRVPPGRFAGDLGSRFVAMGLWLGDMLDVEKPDTLVFEAPLMPRGTINEAGGISVTTTADTVRLLFGLAAWVEGIAHERNVRGLEVNNATWKKFFSGSGRAEKIETVRRCFALGLQVPDDNAADAVGILAFALHIKGEPASWAVPPVAAAPAGEIGPKAWPLSENAKLRKGNAA